jgi:hypothetical protein
VQFASAACGNLDTTGEPAWAWRDACLDGIPALTLALARLQREVPQLGLSLGNHSLTRPQRASRRRVVTFVPAQTGGGNEAFERVPWTARLRVGDALDANEIRRHELTVSRVFANLSAAIDASKALDVPLAPVTPGPQELRPPRELDSTRSSKFEWDIFPESDQFSIRLLVVLRTLV